MKTKPNIMHSMLNKFNFKFDWKLGIGILIILFIIWKFYIPLSREIHNIDYYFIYIALLVYTLIILSRQVRWYILLSQVYKNPSISLTIRSYFLGQFINEIALMGTGDLTKVYIIKNDTGMESGRAMAVPFMERFLDITFLCVATIFYSFMVFIFIPLVYKYILIAIGFSLSVFLLSMAFFPTQIACLVRNKLHIFVKIAPFGFIRKFVLKIESFILKTSGDFHNSLEVYKKKIFIFSMFIFSLIIWVLESVMQVLLIKSLGYEVSLFICIGIVSVSWLVIVPSMIPGGLGIREAVLSFLFSAYGVPIIAAFLSVLIYRSIVMFYFTVGTLISLKLETKPKNING